MQPPTLPFPSLHLLPPHSNAPTPFSVSQSVNNLRRRRRSPGGGGVRAGGRLVDGVVGARAARLLRDGLGAGHLLERDVGVVGALEPVEAPVAAGLEVGGEAVAVAARVDAAVPVAPAVGGRAELLAAGVELAVCGAGLLVLRCVALMRVEEGIGDQMKQSCSWRIKLTHPTPPPGICCDTTLVSIEPKCMT
jgi:hypothetical protein